MSRYILFEFLLNYHNRTRFCSLPLFFAFVTSFTKKILYKYQGMDHIVGTTPPHRGIDTLAKMRQDVTSAKFVLQRQRHRQKNLGIRLDSQNTYSSKWDLISGQGWCGMCATIRSGEGEGIGKTSQNHLTFFFPEDGENSPVGLPPEKYVSKKSCLSIPCFLKGSRPA